MKDQASGQRSSSELSFGERAVGVQFNPSGDTTVDQIKRQFALAIDLMNDARQFARDQEVKRMYSVAITEAQTAQMWGVKAATWRYGDGSTDSEATKGPPAGWFRPEQRPLSR